MKQEMPAKRKTILMDIDGTIFYHKDNLYHMAKDVPVLLDGTIEKLLESRDKAKSKRRRGDWCSATLYISRLFQVLK